MDLQTTLANPLHISRRHLVSIAVLIALLACLLMVSGNGMEQPRFLLDQTGGAVTSLDKQMFRRASDLLARRKYAVLTFDDGPYGHGVDEQILEVLRRHHAHAVFFLVCSHIDETTSHVLGDLERNGHLIGNHSYDHLQLNRLQAPELQHQIEGCSSRIAELTGHRPYYFRPPFGATSPSVKQAAEASGMKQMMWNANSADSWLTRPDQILYWTSEQIENEAILLMHDKPTTAAVLDQALTNLEQRGFQFVLPTQPSSNGLAN